MKKKFLVLLATALVAVGGLAACDPSPPYSGCNLVAGSTEIDPGPFSVPTVNDTVNYIYGLGYNLEYNGTTGEWYSTTPSYVFYGYSAEEDGHWWDCPH